MHINLLTGNDYIDKTTRLFELVYEDKCSTKKKRFSRTFRDDKLNKCFEEIKEIRKELLEKDLNYEGICLFADYINTLEKAYLYKNDSKVNTVTCISPTDSDRKTLYIKNIENNIEIEISAYFDYAERKEAVDMTIKRNGARNIINKWTVYGGVCNAKLEQSDLISILTLNNYVRSELSTLFYSFANCILNKQLFDFEFRNEVLKL